MRRLSTRIVLEEGENPLKVILFPVTSDKNVQKMENENTLTFVCALWANKVQIANAFAKLHNVKVRSVK